MKFKSLFAICSFFTILFLGSCDDDLKNIGGSIQPPSDSISVTVDTIAIKARTVSMLDSVYARTSSGVLGKYEDDLFGTIKSDYLCQFYFPETQKFEDTFKSIDSVRVLIGFNSFLGDTLAPMGLSVYEVTSDLPNNFYTNIDPLKYCDMAKVLANEGYSISGSQVVSATQRIIAADLGVGFGQKIYDAIKDGTIKDNKTFNEYFKGMYVTTNSGSGSLLQVSNTYIDIHYKYAYQDTLGVTRDSTKLFSLAVTGEVLQLNHIKNTNPEHLFTEGTGATYLKTPAGVFTETVFPIGEIIRNMEAKDKTTINSAQFTLKGYTEKEPSLNKYGMMNRPRNLLIIDKDSADVFFKERYLPGNKTAICSLSGVYNSSINSYSFGNIAKMISAYKDKKVENVTFLIIPVTVETAKAPTSNGGYVDVITNVSNYMVPSSAVLRSDPSNMKLELVYSRF